MRNPACGSAKRRLTAGRQKLSLLAAVKAGVRRVPGAPCRECTTMRPSRWYFGSFVCLSLYVFMPALHAETPKDTLVQAWQIDDLITLDPAESSSSAALSMPPTSTTAW